MTAGNLKITVAQAGTYIVTAEKVTSANTHIDKISKSLDLKPGTTFKGIADLFDKGYANIANGLSNQGAIFTLYDKTGVVKLDQIKCGKF
jgi:hypothetical protein